MEQLKLSVYVAKLKPNNSNEQSSIRDLLKSKFNIPANIDDDNNLIVNAFKQMIFDLDTDDMYSDKVSKKCFTVNNVSEDQINSSIVYHSKKQIIEGIIEGGTFGKKRKKTPINNKNNKAEVSESDAITEDFYFFMYIPLYSDKVVLFIQSYSDETIDSVMKKYFQKFFSVQGSYAQPKFNRFFPKSIVDDFKNFSTVSNLVFVTEVPSDTLLSKKPIELGEKKYKVTIQIEPLTGDLSLNEFEKIKSPIQQNTFSLSGIKLFNFRTKKGTLKDAETNKPSKFDLDSDFDIKPAIILSKYLEIKNDKSDFDRIKKYCFTLLDEIKTSIYPLDAIQER
jgi:hypothetical protein